MANRFDIRAVIKKMLENIMKINNLLLLIYMDLKFLYEYLVKLSMTHEK